MFSLIYKIITDMKVYFSGSNFCIFNVRMKRIFNKMLIL
jgi:hypothetical protein